MYKILKSMLAEFSYFIEKHFGIRASGKRSLVTTPAKLGSYQRPSFFSANEELRSKSGEGEHKLTE